MVHGGMTLVKYILFLFNFIFWACGVGVLVTGTVVQISYRRYMNVLGDDFLAMPVLLIAVGGVVAILGFFGCCGAIRENYCMTMTFAVLLGVIFIVEMAAGVAGYVLRKDARDIVLEKMRDGMVNYNVLNDDGVAQFGGVTRAWDELQQRVGCCGVESYSDWANATVFANNEHVPDSCCRRRVDDDGEGVRRWCGHNVRSEDYTPTQRNRTIAVTGCVPSVIDWVNTSYALVAGVGGAILAVQLLTMLAALCFSKVLRNMDERAYAQGHAANSVPMLAQPRYA